MLLLLVFIFFLAWPQSCEDIKMIDSNARDGGYKLWYPMSSVWIEIYCHNMTGKPVEYLTLPAGRETNYIYKGQAHSFPPWGSPCRGEFSKVRLILTYQPKIHRTDATFMTTNDPQCSPFTPHDRTDIIDGYGSASDCSWGNFGNFSIDLSGTIFHVPKIIEWRAYGYQSQMKNYWKSSDGKMVSATCGGYCGNCRPVSEGKYLPLNLTGRFLCITT